MQPASSASGRLQHSGTGLGTCGIALDWGTTNLRAFLLDAGGGIVEQREKPWGILSLPVAAGAGGGSGAGGCNAGGFDAALEGVAADWMSAHPHGPLIASGMVGSAQGWREAPYVGCPAGAAELAGRMARVATASGRELLIVPGILLDQPDALPDVMRGEETQVIGALQSMAAQQGGEARTVCFVLPGTHCKWVLVRNRQIEQFATYMTGELFANLQQHSILGKLMKTPPRDAAQAAQAKGPDRPDRPDGAAGAAGAAAFLQALALAQQSGPGDLMRHLFTARSMNLAGRLPATALADYLSGLLIGHELVSAAAWLERQGAVDAPLVLVGEAALLARYQAALQAFGRRALCLPNTAAAGLHHLLTLAAAARPQTATHS